VSFAKSLSSSIIMLWKIMHAVIMLLIWSRSQPYVGPLTTAHLDYSTPIACSMSLRVASCALVKTDFFWFMGFLTVFTKAGHSG
jgi:hypothetical protein